MICRVVAEIIWYILCATIFARACEDTLRIRTPADETRNSACFMNGNRLVALHRVLVAANLRDHSVAQSKSLVAMLLDIFDVDVLSFRNVDRANCFEETERDYGVYRTGHLVGRRRAQANRRSNPLQAVDRSHIPGFASGTR